MEELKKYLPIGTVVLLKGGQKRLMITGFCSIPVNVFLLTKFNVWMDYLYNGSGKIHKIALIIGYTIVLTGMEEIVLGLFTRILWKKQCKLYIPVDDDE